ncbi:MAG TPA: efflux RND transporter periplasmic adaptor subunit [Candidatus Krumholzibacteria bacterium]|nr:efflux RND transporter periplasmic adaptor subunit [Candidatus Krumholzibacteria bacterium]
MKTPLPGRISVFRAPLLTAAAKRAWVLALALVACQKEEQVALYQEHPVERRTIVVSASAAGVIEPVRTVEVKSKASGEIIELLVETGTNVKAGQLLAVVDRRQPQNTLSQAQADLNVAKAQLEINKSKLDRAESLFKERAITESEYEDARLSFVTANAQVVRAQTDLENARIQMDDTRIRAPVDGTIISKQVELGTVISSPTRDVGGGSILFTMANLDTVQIRTRIDETDIGQVTPGMAASITVDAYPERRFDGAVLKIEPQATVEQNVTMFPALVRIANPGHALLPGMNAEVEIHVGRRENALAIPYAALRTPRDAPSAAVVLGIDPSVLDSLYTPRPSAGSEVARNDAGGGAGDGGGRGGRGGAGGPGGGARFGGRRNSYIVFVLRDAHPTPVMVRTGLTDLDYVEVLDGLTESDTVLVLPSASLVASQEEMRQRIERMTGGSGLPGVQQQQTQPPQTTRP